MKVAYWTKGGLIRHAVVRNVADGHHPVIQCPLCERTHRTRVVGASGMNETCWTTFRNSHRRLRREAFHNSKERANEEGAPATTP